MSGESSISRVARATRGEGEPPASRRIWTIPNILSFARIALIPVVVVLLVRPGSEAFGLLLLGIVVATDWIDGQIARRFNQVSELGKLLDPTADRLVIAAALVALVIRGAFPLWAAALVVGRDMLFLIVGGSLLTRRITIPVRFVGKVATFSLMVAIPLIAWGSFDLQLSAAATVLGWMTYSIGIIEYYIAAVQYVGDIRMALDQQKRGSSST